MHRGFRRGGKEARSERGGKGAAQGDAGGKRAKGDRTREKVEGRLERLALRKAAGHHFDLAVGMACGADAVELDWPVMDVLPRDLVAFDKGAHMVDEHL